MPTLYLPEDAPPQPAACEIRRSFDAGEPVDHDGTRTSAGTDETLHRPASLRSVASDAFLPVIFRLAGSLMSSLPLANYPVVGPGSEAEDSLGPERLALHPLELLPPSSNGIPPPNSWLHLPPRPTNDHLPSPTSLPFDLLPSHLPLTLPSPSHPHISLRRAPSSPAMAQQPLFTIPIPPMGAHVGGSIVCTEPAPSIYLLTWSSPPDNRLTTPFCHALLSALDVIEFGGYKPGVVVTTSAIQKFYSNGLDLEHAINTDGFWALFYQVWRRFLTFPMPTLALLNGHTYAGGLMLALSHDYRLAPSPRGFMCLNEMLFGAPLKPAMAAIFRHKLTPLAYRSVALEARRFSAAEAVEMGLADGIATSLDDALKFIADRDLLSKPKAGVYGVIKAEMHKTLIAELKSPGLDAEEARFDQDQRTDGERKEFGKVWYEQWAKDAAKSKL
ncbi:hypothetical protein RJ55_06719 [Drechmeria coniospora]|nr:hypothetical protein RJ55_06719 [Drechmeria coniospora]